MKLILYFILALFHSLVISSPIEALVSASAGGPTDTLTRNIVKILHEKTDLRFVVINKPGGSHAVALNYLQSSNRPTIMIGSPEVTSHRAFKQMTEVVQLGKFSLLVFASRTSAIYSLKDVIELSKSRDILYGHGGENTFSFMGLIEVCKTISRCLNISYRSGAEGLTGVAAGHIDLYTLVSYGAKPFLDNQHLRVIHRIDNVDYIISVFSKNLSDDIVAIISNAIKKSIDKSFLAEMGLINEF